MSISGSDRDEDQWLESELLKVRSAIGSGRGRIANMLAKKGAIKTKDTKLPSQELIK